LKSRRPAFLSLALVAAVALAGCAGANTSVRNFKGTQRDVADAIADFQSAGQRKDEKKICTELLTVEFANSMRAPKRSCQDEISDALADSDDFDLTVKAVSVNGANATAQVENADRTTTFRLQRVGAAWRIASLGES
jgi:hypothetical protein